MVVKKRVSVFLLFFCAASLQTMEKEETGKIKYFLTYKNARVEISLVVLQRAKVLKDIWEEQKDLSKDDEQYTKFHDSEGNFVLSLDPMLQRIKLPDGRPLAEVVKLNDIKLFVTLLGDPFKVDKVEANKLILQMNIANVFGAEAVLDACAKSLAEKIKKADPIKILSDKGLLWAIFNELSDDVLDHVLKKYVVKNITVPFVELKGHSSSVVAIVWSPDGKRLASGSWDGTVRVWNPDKGTILKVLKGHKDSIYTIAWSPDGSRLASGSRDETVIVWDPDKGMILKVLEGHSGFFDSVAWSPDGTQLAFGSVDRTVIVWDPDKGMILKVLEGHSDGVTTVAWSPDGKRLASGSYDKTVRVWDPHAGKELKDLRGHEDYVTAVAWSPDGKRLASASRYGTVIVWNPHTGKKLKVLKGDRGVVTAVAWSPDGTQLAFDSIDGTVRVWDPDKGMILKVLEGHSYGVTTVAWSPDGSRLASASDDKTVRVWDPHAGKVLKVLRGHKGWALSIAWSPDGTQLASGSYDKTVRIWNVDVMDVNYSFKQLMLVGAIFQYYKKYKEPLVISQTKWVLGTRLPEYFYGILFSLPKKMIRRMERSGWIEDFRLGEKYLFTQDAPRMKELRHILENLKIRRPIFGSIPISEGDLKVLKEKALQTKNTMVSKKGKEVGEELEQEITKKIEVHRLLIKARLVFQDVLRGKKRLSDVKELIESDLKKIEELGHEKLADDFRLELNKILQRMVIRSISGVPLSKEEVRELKYRK